VEVQLVPGIDPAIALIDLRRARSGQLIVVASVSKTLVERWTLGSVSERTAEHAPCPTLVVRAAAPLVEWTEGRRRLKVFLAVDFSPGSVAAIRCLQELQKIGPCDIVAGHVCHPPAMPGRAAASGHPAADLAADQREALHRDLAQQIRAQIGPHDLRLRVQPSWGKPDAPLVAMAIAEQADLVVVGTHQWHGLSRVWHPSTSRGILRHAPMNVVCVPADSIPLSAP
jgi:nucleotide-binding universal stress UspA family protein